jgi:hypothetical protein
MNPGAAATICPALVLVMAVIAVAIRHAKDLTSCVLAVTAVYARDRKKRKRARKVLRDLQG